MVKTSPQKGWRAAPKGRSAAQKARRAALFAPRSAPDSLARRPKRVASRGFSAACDGKRLASHAFSAVHDAESVAPGGLAAERDAERSGLAPDVRRIAQSGVRQDFRSGRLSTIPTETSEMTFASRVLMLLCLCIGFYVVPARAETFHTCGTVIASLPTVISSQGVFCLTHDLSTAITVGNAIDIQTNNVTIDCNGYKIGGLAAGSTSAAFGIHASDTRVNITVRNCGIRGFQDGIKLDGGSGHLIEDNRLDNNLYVGIFIGGDNNTIRRNRIYDTGGYTGSSASTAMIANGDVIDNTISGVFATGGTPFLIAVDMEGGGTVASGNRISGIAVTGAGSGYGIYVSNAGISVRDNDIVSTATITGTGIVGQGVTDTICSGNHVFKFTNPIGSCQDGGHNASN
jgi:parallel beta-helix repeat protein